MKNNGAIMGKILWDFPRGSIEVSKNGGSKSTVLARSSSGSAGRPAGRVASKIGYLFNMHLRCNYKIRLVCRRVQLREKSYQFGNIVQRFFFNTIGNRYFSHLLGENSGDFLVSFRTDAQYWRRQIDRS